MTVTGSNASRKRVRSARTRRAGWALVALVILGAGGILMASRRGLPLVQGRRPARPALERLDVYGQVPEFSLIERSRETVTRADLLGKVWIVNFFYTRCRDTCPIQSAHIARLQAQLSDQPDVRFLSISVDPGYDTPERLAAYANRYGARPDRWLFLTGPRQAIERLAVDGFHLAVAPGDTARREVGEGWARLGPARAWAHAESPGTRIQLVHSSRFVLLDRHARIRGYYEGTDWDALTRLRENLARLLRGDQEDAALGAPATPPSVGTAAEPPSGLPGVVAAAAETPARSWSLADAMKELALIRPARRELAEDFTTPMPGGGAFRLSVHRGNVVFLNFWATWCPPCLEEMPTMERLWRRHKDEPFVMLAVSIDADPTAVGPFLAQRGFTFPVGLDPMMRVARAYRLRALPTTVIVGRQGHVEAVAFGSRVWDSEAAHALVEGLVK